MGVASLGGRTFRIDPYEVEWEFRAKTRDIKTVGGKVVQIFGTSVGDMTVRGQFGVGSVFEQYAMLKRMKEEGDRTVVQANIRNVGATPMRFLYASKGWDFQVYLKGYTEVGQGRAVHHTVDNFSPTWELTLFVVQDNTGLKKIAEDAFIKRLANGLGWKWQQSKYNGPMGPGEIRQALNGRTVQEALMQGYGLGAQVPGGSTGEPPDTAAGTPTVPSAGVIPKADLVALLRGVGFKGEGLRIAYAVAMAESGGRADAVNNKNRNGSIDRGLFQINSVHQSSISPVDMMDPAKNAAFAFNLSGGGTNWNPWVTYKQRTAAYVRYYNEGI